MRNFVLNYVQENQHSWRVQPEVWADEHELQDCVVLAFGKPRTAVFAHMDSIGFTVKYERELVKIGGATFEHDYVLVGKDAEGEIECTLQHSEGAKKAHYKYEREIEPGTELLYKCDFRQSDDFVQSCYLDNRLGVWNALKLAETLEDGLLVFSCYEEHGGGAVNFLARVLYEKYGVRQALISDITWVTDGVRHGKGVAISLRDRSIPRRSYTSKIVALAKESGIPYQIEVESAGGSDGQELQNSAYPWDWCFIGAAEANVHTPDEKVHKKDIEAMLQMYQYLMQKL